MIPAYYRSNAILCSKNVFGEGGVCVCVWGSGGGVGCFGGWAREKIKTWNELKEVYGISLSKAGPIHILTLCGYRI